MYANRPLYHIIIHQIILFFLIIFHIFNAAADLLMKEYFNSSAQNQDEAPDSSSSCLLKHGWVMTTVNPALIWTFIYSFIHSFTVRVYVWGAWVNAIYSCVGAIIPDFWGKLRLKLFHTNTYFSSLFIHNIELLRTHSDYFPCKDGQRGQLRDRGKVVFRINSTFIFINFQ